MSRRVAERRLFQGRPADHGLTTVGCSTKNAILIIEFAVDLQNQGMGPIEAMLEAVKLRLRPILMTSIAFVLGAVPRVISSCAGSASQNAIGTGVAGGMISGTVLAVFLLPLFYVVVRGLTARPNRANDSELHAITAVDIGHA